MVQLSTVVRCLVFEAPNVNLTTAKVSECEVKNIVTWSTVLSCLYIKTYYFWGHARLESHYIIQWCGVLGCELCFDWDVAEALSVVTGNQPFNLCFISFNLAGITFSLHSQHWTFQQGWKGLMGSLLGHSVSSLHLWEELKKQGWGKGNKVLGEELWQRLRKKLSKQNSIYPWSIWTSSGFLHHSAPALQ